MRGPFRLAFFIALALLFSSLAGARERQANANYRARRQKLAGKLDGGAALLFAPAETEGPNDVYGYFPDADFYYLTGWSEPGAALLVVAPAEAKNDNPAHAYTEILFLPDRNSSQEKWTGAKLGPDDPQAAQLTGADSVESLGNLRTELVKLFPARGGRIYTDVPASGETSNSTEPLSWLENANAFAVGTSFRDIRPLLESLRPFKDAGELALIRKATDASIAAQFAAIRAIKPGVTEREISALLEYEWGKRGCERPAYAPIVARESTPRCCIIP